MKVLMCEFCGSIPFIRLIKVYYTTIRKHGFHDMFRVECKCGAIGKCRPTQNAAINAWNEPWQAMVI
jgi:hypothetical protein